MAKTVPPGPWVLPAACQPLRCQTGGRGRQVVDRSHRRKRPRRDSLQVKAPRVHEFMKRMSFSEADVRNLSLVPGWH